MALADTGTAAAFDFSWSSPGTYNGGADYNDDHVFSHGLADNSLLTEQYQGAFPPSFYFSSHSGSYTSTSGGMDIFAGISGTGALSASSFSRKKASDMSETAAAEVWLSSMTPFLYTPEAGAPAVVNVSGLFTSGIAHTSVPSAPVWEGNAILLIRHDIHLYGDDYDSDGDGILDSTYVWQGCLTARYDHMLNSLLPGGQVSDVSIAVTSSVDMNPLSSGFSAFRENGSGIAWNNSFSPLLVDYSVSVALGVSAMEQELAVLTPEPRTLPLLGLGAVVLFLFRRKARFFRFVNQK